MAVRKPSTILCEKKRTHRDMGETPTIVIGHCKANIQKNDDQANYNFGRYKFR